LQYDLLSEPINIPHAQIGAPDIKTRRLAPRFNRRRYEPLIAPLRHAISTTYAIDDKKSLKTRHELPGCSTPR